jgi:hypothetical protein
MPTRGEVGEPQRPNLVGGLASRHDPTCSPGATLGAFLRSTTGSTMGSMIWRRLRGAFGLGLVWAATWATAGSLTRWVFGVNTDLPLPLLFGGLGLLSGMAFSVVLVVATSRRLDVVSLPRFAVGGAVMGLLFGVLFVRGASYGALELIVIPITFVVASAASAAGSLALARRAAPVALPAGAAPPELGEHL